MKVRTSVLVLLLTGLFLLQLPGFIYASEPQPFRVIPVPRESTISDMSEPLVSIILRTKAELNSFIAGLLEEQNGIPPDERYFFFVNELKKAKLDFRREALVLLQHTEQSGTPQVVFHPPELNGQRLICTIEGEALDPNMCLNMIMASYCEAIAVLKEQIKEVEVRDIGAGVEPRKAKTTVLRIR